MKNQPIRSLSLFESNEKKIESSSPEQSGPPKSEAAEKIKDACPRCSGRSLKTVRSWEHGGATHYCAGGCLSEDRTEAFYFTPQAETFVEQVEREEAKKTVASTTILASEQLVDEETEEIVVSASKYDQEKLFASSVTPATGKTLEALEYSRERTTEVMRMFDGHLPQSIMKAEKKSRGAADLATGSYSATEKYTGAFAKSSSGCAYGALSAFPQNIGKACLLLYTSRGETVFDPFAGHNSRMEFCVRNGRNYIGCDISKKFMQFNRERAELLREEYPEARIELHEIDSRKIDEIKLETQADFTITSPPYYDIEDYGDEYQQLGKCSENYFEFCRNMQKVAEANFRKLRAGAFCVWFINDFRREGVFHPYHIDTFRILKDAGFSAWDMMITDFGGSFGQCFPAQVVDRKILPKRHEYGVVMRKI